MTLPSRIVLIIHYIVRIFNVALYYYVFPFLVSLMTLIYAYRWSYLAHLEYLDGDQDPFRVGYTTVEGFAA